MDEKEWRQHLEPLKAIDLDLYEAIVDLDECARQLEPPGSPPADWGNNDLWLDGFMVLDERVHFAYSDLLNGLRKNDISKRRILALAADYRRWLVAYVWASDAFSDKLRLSTQKTEFFGQYPSLEDTADEATD